MRGSSCPMAGLPSKKPLPTRPPPVSIAPMTTPPVALTIAGSDCSSGAGIQADLKTFQHFNVHGLTAVTCIVSETANIVRAVHPVPVEIVTDQVEVMFDAFPIAAVKTGMLLATPYLEALT